VSGLNVELTSVYWIACPSVCRHPVRLQSVTDVDKFYVVSSLPFDGTGRHVVRHVLVVAGHNATAVRLELPQSAGDHEVEGMMATPRSRYVHLDAFQSYAVESLQSDLTGLAVEASYPVFVSVSLSSKLRASPPSTTRSTQPHSTPPPPNSSVQNEQILLETTRRYVTLSDDEECRSSSSS